MSGFICQQKNILIPTFQHLKRKVLTCQYLFLSQEITCYAVFATERTQREYGFAEAYLSKSALKGCHDMTSESCQLTETKRITKVFVLQNLSELQQLEMQFSLPIYIYFTEIHTAWDGSALI